MARETQQTREGGQATLGGTTASDATPTNVYRTPDGREIPLPEGVTADQVQALFARVQSGGFQNMSDADRALMRRLRPPGGGPGPGGAERQRRTQTSSLMGAEYIVFVLREGQPTAVAIRTGLTDLDYSEVRNGLTDADTVLILPSASLMQSQAEWSERMNRMGGGGIPGVQRQTGSQPSGR
jgi:hypothetical protein